MHDFGRKKIIILRKITRKDWYFVEK